MKKSYFEPTTEMVKVAVDQILMGSYDGTATGANVSFQDESDFDTFFK